MTEEQLQALAFQIGMTELVSYWKIACPKKVVVKPFALTEKQKAFWKKLYYNGLGEFLYLNSISVSEEDLMEIEPLPIDSKPSHNLRRNDLGNWFEEKTLVPSAAARTLW